MKIVVETLRVFVMLIIFIMAVVSLATIITGINTSTGSPIE